MNRDHLNKTFQQGSNTIRQGTISPPEKFSAARAPGVELSATFYNMKKPINRKLKVANDDIPMSHSKRSLNRNFQAAPLSNNPTYSELPPIISRQDTN